MKVRLKNQLKNRHPLVKLHLGAKLARKAQIGKIVILVFEEVWAPYATQTALELLKL